MKLRNLSLVLFFAACGGGKDPVVIVDSPPGDGGGVFPNSRNDMVLVTFPEEGSGTSLTPDADDAPDNASPVVIDTSTTGFGFSGEMGIAGDRSDEYFERDTFLISTGPTTNQLTVRLAWDGGTSDHDFLLIEEPAAGEVDLLTLASGTLISDTANEFQTFTVDPNTNYWLWTGVYMENAGGGAPSLPALYDLAVYGNAVSPAATPACNTAGVVNEGNDANNANNGITVFGGDLAKREANNVTIATGTPLIICGTLDTGNFLLTPSTTDAATLGTNDVDAYAFNLALESDLLITLIGETDADQTALQALAATASIEVALFNDPCVGAQCPDTDTVMPNVQPRPQQFFGSSLTTYLASHGVTAVTRMVPSNFDPVEMSPTPALTDVVGPKTLAVFMTSNAATTLAAAINYKIIVTVDPRDTRAGRITGGLAEANDN